MNKLSLASKIMISMVLGLIIGLVIKALPETHFIDTYLVNGIFDVIGKIFIALLEMLVVPIVFVSLVCGTCSIGDSKKLGRLGLKTLLLFIFTTAFAVTLGILLANLFNIGHGSHLLIQTQYQPKTALSLKETIINIIPSNPIKAMDQGNLLQVIIFAILIGIAIAKSGKTGQKVVNGFNAVNEILMNLILIVMKFAPYGVFCLIAGVIAKIGLSVIGDLLLYVVVSLLALAIQLFGIYSLLLIFLAKLNPKHFFKKMYSVMLFAFSTSSSNATIPTNMETAQHKLGIHNSITSFVIPLGATINMDGTAIMQGIATVFIAHLYHLSLSMNSYVLIVITATLASIGTAGVPGVGIITLAMVLQQVGLPIEGIGIIIGVDRLMDMFRTIVNVSGDTVTACIVGKSENEIDVDVYKEKKPCVKPF